MCSINSENFSNFQIDGSEVFPFVDPDTRFGMTFLWTPFMADIERRLLQNVLAEARTSIVAKPDQKNVTVEKPVTVDFLILGIGLWTMKRGDAKDREKSLRRVRQFEQGLPRIIQVPV